MSYLEDATDFTDMVKKENPAKRYKKPEEEFVECPKCHGYGSWNLKLNAYPLHDKENTPENRTRFSHSKGGCVQCNGWGWVIANSRDVTCIHEYKEIGGKRCSELGITHYGRCWHVYECQKCGATMSQDSSD